ncbi:FGGY-family carbohydrate kinase [Thermostaphylospora chromogena]|uniref:Gluconokinase n=1 Tax=Thermostaphylospora chromogena TaxID=35622 RepID=A0A1H1D7V6_9ACTN|nr:FGGY-family carbohydrate kinase [Thermostaphylospora chromogena]SDQ72258.1 gluconokinase [Thermostaphylospora chromogena]
MRVVVGVDVGSGSARAIAVDPDGRVLAARTGAYPGAEEWPEGRADPRGWLTGVADAVNGLLDTLGARPEAICVGGQSPTTVPVGGGLAVTVRHPAGSTGGPDDQHYAQRAVLAAELGEVEGRQLYDWVSARLGAADAQARWPGDATLDGYGPRAETGEVVGHTDGTLGLPAGVPLVAGAQDAYLAFWAGGLDLPGRALDPGGRTGGLAVAVKAGDEQTDMYSLRSPAIGVDIIGGPVNGHGLMLEWLSRTTGRAIPELLRLAEEVPEGADGLLILPYLEGERAPRWNRELRAEIVGLSSAHGSGHLARAVLEATAYGLRHIADSLPPVPIDTLVCAGGPASSPLWCKIKADVLEVPVEVPTETGLAAYGAALAAGAGAGWWPMPGRAEGGAWPRPAATTIHPSPSRVYRDGYRRFLALGDAAERRLAATSGKQE